ncbi:MAG: single-stranded DNA-binding protein [Eubacterium sp.]|nr:single-stranded DNA-binding protein [Eubacterium sp.]
MNKVILMGRLTRDPEIRYSQGEQATAVAKYTLAVDRRFVRNNGGENQQTADFISCVAFGRAAEFAERFLRKGIKIAVTGRIQTGSYVRQDGQKVYTTDVVVEDHEFAESKNASAEYTGNMGNAGNMSHMGNTGGMGSGYVPADRPMPSAADDGFMNIPDGIDEELPFN